MSKSISIAETKHNAKRARQRRADALRGKHIVYIVGRDMEAGCRYKVGRTSNLTARINVYESSCGERVMCLFQVIVRDAAEAAKLEKVFVGLLDESMVVYGREWFSASKWELARMMEEAIKQSGIEPVSVGGYDGFNRGTFGKQIHLDAVNCMKTCASFFPRLVDV